MSDTEALAQLLAADGHGVYSTAAGGSIFCGELPDEPAEAIAVAPYPGPAGNAALPWDQPRFQVAVRGSSYTATEDRAAALYSALVGRAGVQLGDAWVSLIYPIQSGPVWLPTSTRGRHTFLINLGLHLHRAGPHRTVS